MESYSYSESYRPTVSMTAMLAPVMAELVRKNCGLKTEDEKAMDFIRSLGDKPSGSFEDRVTELADKIASKDKTLTYTECLDKAREIISADV